MSRPLTPKGGNDRIYTPDDLARKIVEHFQPEGTILEPCKGTGAFLKHLPLHARWMEIDEGRDFLNESSGKGWRYDWIVTNPPYSKFRAFLKRSMEMADNIVFLSLLNAFFMKARLRDIQEQGFGFREILMVDTPPSPWPQMGIQLAATHIQHGYSGPVTITYN
jgi:type I restriction-modification system DNA methylase subunit